MSSLNQTMTSLQNEGGSSNFQLTIYLFYRIFYINWKKAVNSFLKKPGNFFSLAFTLLNLFQVWVSCCLSSYLIIYLFLLTDFGTTFLHMLAWKYMYLYKRIFTISITMCINYGKLFWDKYLFPSCLFV